MAGGVAADALLDATTAASDRDYSMAGLISDKTESGFWDEIADSPRKRALAEALMFAESARQA